MTLFDPAAPVKDRISALTAHLKSLAKDDRPILVGPWRSELGFEATYWTPFLQWIAKQVPTFKARAFVVTRGGLAPLYSGFTSGGADLYGLRPIRDVRRENLYDQRQSGLQKQVTPTPWDTQVLADAASALNLGHAYHVVHPAWMYWCFGPFWHGAVGMQHVQGMTDFEKLPVITLDGATLPASYIAVRFYGRATFPYPHPDVVEFVQQVVGGLASQSEIVLLNSPEAYDDHQDILVTGDHIHRLPDDLAPAQHLAVHAAVLKQATAFVGTYGGVAQLALRLGVPSVSFYHQWGGTSHQHLALNDYVAKVQGTPFLVSGTSDAQLWRQTVAGLVAPVAPMAMVPA
jgi:hypothetical protein